jgi:hypothetical protein
MPTKRHKRLPRRISGPVPAWAERLLATGRKPDWTDPDHDEYAGWFCGDEVPGLPDAHSPEGFQLWGDGHADETS